MGIPALFKKVGDEIAAMNNLKSFNPQNLSNTIWAYATANIHHPDLFKKIANEIIANLSSFKPQELANTVWAYAIAGIYHPDLFEKVANEIVVRDDFSSFVERGKLYVLQSYIYTSLLEAVSHNSVLIQGSLLLLEQFV